MTALLFWDIDGTLLTTGRAGIHAWEDAAREVAGRPVDLSALPTAGLTDFEVGRAILDHLDLAPDGDRLAVRGETLHAWRQPSGWPDKARLKAGSTEFYHGLLARLVRRYEERLPASLPRKVGRVLAGVREILEFLRTERPDVESYLLTGNTQAGARAKLSYYELDRYFAGGGFSDDAPDRRGIARRALEVARAGRPVSTDRTFVIGDTPHDIRCGQAIGARTVAVASGEYSVEALLGCGPWRVYERLPGPAAFIAMLEEQP